MKQLTKDLCKIFGFALALAQTFTLSLTFFVAYFQHDQKLLIAVNPFGEANLEFLVILFVLFFAPFSFYLMLKDLVIKRIH